MAKRKRGRPRIQGPKRSVVLSIRLTPQERDLIGDAAGDYPPGIWARIAVVRAAREATGKTEKGAKKR